MEAIPAESVEDTSLSGPACAWCSAGNPAGSRFCNQCGAALGSLSRSAAGQSAQPDSLPDLQAWRAFPLIGSWFARGGRGVAWLVGASVALYYGVPLVLNWWQGTLAPPDLAERLQAPAAFHPLLNALAARHATGVVTHWALLDATHTIVTVGFLPAGLLLLHGLLRAASTAFRRLWENQVLACSRERFAQIIQEANRRLARPTNHVVSGSCALILSGTFLAMAQMSALAGWWGHCQHGPAGFYLALLVGLCTYYTGQGALLLLNLLTALRNVMDCPVILRPLHPDRCSGFRPLGDLMLWLYGAVIWAGGGIFTVYFIGVRGSGAATGPVAGDGPLRHRGAGPVHRAGARGHPWSAAGEVVAATGPREAGAGALRGDVHLHRR